jgi:rhodanese-related sulfurtransferase
VTALPLLGFPLAGWAQGKNYTSVEEALKDVKQAGGTCPRDDGTTSNAGVTLLGADATPDLGCILSPAEAVILQGRPDTVLIDTRSMQEFDLFHIDNSLKLTTSELRVKPFLQNKMLILAGNGKGERELYVACGELKRAGFKDVKVLHGGLPLWLTQQQPVIGRIAAVENLVRLSPAQLWAETRFDANLVLLMPGMAMLRKEFQSVVLLREDSLDGLKSIIEKQNRNFRKKPLASVVLVADGAMASERISQLIQVLKPLPVLVYADSAEAFRQFVVSQEAAWKIQARGPKQPKCGL